MRIPKALASGVPPSIPTRAVKPPVGPDWVHEIKHDGYRLQVRRAGTAVRLFTRRGFDWSGRYPAISAAAAKLSADSFTLDGEAVVAGRTVSRSSTNCTGTAPLARRCFTPSTF